MFNFYGRSAKFRKDLALFWERLYRVSYAYCRDPQVAADLVQGTLEAALNNKHKISDYEYLEKWLFRVLVNRWRDYCRTRKYHEDIGGLHLVQHETPESHSELEETVEQVLTAMGRLKEEHREVLSLIAIEGFSYSQVASILDLPMGTVMSRLCRSRQYLREYLASPDQLQNRRGAKAKVRGIK
ncbi:hypothetical protein MNBD_GAMMA08-2051 [hydrothermal vent metagenome]|uniref:Uncharacterized protein n=1 Tax=hydrothermal vent metagenome TaxID=652676 RepID=A0A3B0XI56_9ZZZZ